MVTSVKFVAVGTDKSVKITDLATEPPVAKSPEFLKANDASSVLAVTVNAVGNGCRVKVEVARRGGHFVIRDEETSFDNGSLNEIDDRGLPKKKSTAKDEVSV